jgi:UDP-glucose 4-epimerase
MLIEIAGAGRVRYVEWPADKKAIDIGDFYADSSKFARATGWQPSVPLEEGLRQTLDFYRRHFDRYADRTDPSAESS